MYAVLVYEKGKNKKRRKQVEEKLTALGYTVLDAYKLKLTDLDKLLDDSDTIVVCIKAEDKMREKLKRAQERGKLIIL